MVKQRKKKFKYWNKVLACLAAMLMLIGCIPGTVQADYYIPDEKGDFQLTLQVADADGNQTPLPGVGLKLYKVSTVNFDGNVHFVLDSALAATDEAKDIDFDKLDGSTASTWLDTAATLADAVAKTDITSQEATSDGEGKIEFTDLEEGMYLLVQNNPESTRVAVSPMLLSVPFVKEGEGWVYQVQAYPKCVINPDETGITVTKRVFLVNTDTSSDIGYELIPVIAEDATFKVGIFLDPQGTIPFQDDYIREIHLKKAHEGSTLYKNVPDGTYYIFELDENNKPIQLDKAIEYEKGKELAYNVTNSDDEKTNAAVISQLADVQAVAYVNNRYYQLPDGFFPAGKISITKKVLVDGQQTQVDGTFYAGIFKKDGNDLTLVTNMKLNQNGTVDAEFKIEDATAPEKVTYVVKETDKDGNILDPDEFPYEISGEGEVTLKSSEDYEGSVTLTNSKTTTVTNTPAPGGSGDNGGGGNAPRSGGATSQHPVKTGDNTNIAIWVVLLAAAVVIIGFIGFRSKKRKNK